jgi:hypothetical protein
MPRRTAMCWAAARNPSHIVIDLMRENLVFLARRITVSFRPVRTRGESGDTERLGVGLWYRPSLPRWPLTQQSRLLGRSRCFCQ